MLQVYGTERAGATNLACILPVSYPPIEKMRDFGCLDNAFVTT